MVCPGRRRNYITSWLLPCLLQGGLCIRITDMQIPGTLVKGSEVTLRCQFDPEGKDIYAVKWYKDRQEFYHFLPRNSRPKDAYNITGFRVVLEKSSESEVTLAEIGDKAAGTYKCEISTEGPNFWTAFEENNVTVVALPQRRPEIWGHRRFYSPGENISVNCTSPNSSPAARINWFINDEQVSHDNIRRWLTPAGNQLVTSTGNLRMTVRRQHFRRGVLQLKCTASLTDVYWDSVEVKLTATPDTVRGARSHEPFTAGGVRAGETEAVLTLLLCSVVFLLLR